MAGPVLHGQARAAALAGAARALSGGDDVDLDALLPAWRALSPACHPLAGADVVDVPSLVDVLARRPGLLSTAGAPGLVDVVDDDPRGGPPDRAAARALADALVVRLEGRKIAHGLPAPPAALRAAFSDPDTARAALAAVRDLPAVALAMPPPPRGVDALAIAVATHKAAGHPIHVVVGPAVRRLLDLLSPYCRRLRVDLALAGRPPGGVPDDDDVYRGLDRLLREATDTVAERRAHDAAEGLVDDDVGFVIDGARLVEDLVDRRARGLVPALKRARVVVVGVVDGGALAGLDLVPASTQALVDVRPHDDGAPPPGALVDAATGAVLPLAGDGPPSLSLPWRGLATHDSAVADEGGFATLQALWRRRVDEPRWPAPGVVFGDEPTRGALQALAALVPAGTRRGAP
ncbi:MAG: hypothetical protein FJ137_04195 [Deltaproteobacteria bacterium]|nr:hypothetical protein [Deltaproteobacteria bacterium]